MAGKSDKSGSSVDNSTSFSVNKSKRIRASREASSLGKPISATEMYTKVMEIFDDAIIGLTNDFKVSVWSRGAEREFGYKKSEIIGKSVKGLIPEDRLYEIEEEINTLKQGNVIEGYETVRLHKSGKPIDVSISIVPIFSPAGTVNGAAAIYKDVSEKKDLVKKLDEYERKCKLALEGGQFGIWDLDIKNRTLSHFNNWEKTLGYKEDQLGNSADDWLSLVHPDDISLITDKFNRHFKSREEYVVEYRIRCRNNAYKWVRSKGRISKWSKDGEPIRMIGTNEDISNERLIQKELEEKYEQLELLKQEAESASKAKSQFLANVSHEIRTPMNGIIATIQLLQSTNLSHEQRRYADLLKNSADNLVAIINSILDISKLESGKIELSMEPFNLRETINSIFETFLIAANTKGLEAGCYIDPGIEWEVIGDELRLRQILSNLLSNAVKYTDQGYISFRTRLISSEGDEQKIEFSIRDTGIGIDESYKPKIFQTFSQGDLSREKKYMGTGLGLAISKQLADLMNGEIHFESTVGQGSTFYFTCGFKRREGSTALLKENRDIKSGEGQKLSARDKVILCIEDNLINQEIMESIIIKNSYKYIAAYDGNEALEKLNEHKVDLILMDIQMPGLNGYEVTRIIREKENGKEHVPIIGMTAYAMHEDRDKCIQAGMDDYISKPIDVDMFYNILDTYLVKK